MPSKRAHAVDTAPQPRGFAPSILLVVYVAAALGLDLMTLDRDFPLTYWRVSVMQDLNGFDLYKFLAWFAIPFALCLFAVVAKPLGRVFPPLEPGYFGFTRWKAVDWVLLALIAACGLIAVLLIPRFESLHSIYPTLSDAAVAVREDFLRRQVLWWASWLIGWEFLHRYVLLRHFGERWRWGWVIVPLSEGLYHLVKPLPEAAGMVLLSVVVTLWALKRRNVMLPFLGHLVIELELLAYQLWG